MGDDTIEVSEKIEQVSENIEQQQPSGSLFFAVIVCCVSPLLFGSSIAYTSPTLNTMQNETSGSGMYPPESLSVFENSWEGSSYAAILLHALLGQLDLREPFVCTAFRRVPSI